MKAMKPIQRRVYGQLPDGRPVHEFTMDNGRGLRLSAITLGGIVTRLEVPDARGELANVVLGLPTLGDYLLRNPHFGVIVGRYGNRIAEAAFRLDGERHGLVANDGSNCLHGGARGFGTQLWRAEPESDGCLRLELDSPAGDQGFPGRLRAVVRYRIDEDMGWAVEYEATTDAPTVVNLTHHDYFNLAGRGSVLGHELQIAGSRYCEVNDALIPTAMATVVDTPFDFREPRVIESRLRQGHPQLQRGKGYDHHWVLDAPFDGQLHLAARLRDPLSGRSMEVLTTEPGVQFYSGNFLDGSLLGSDGAFYRQGDGLCLETQHAPDSPNRPISSDWPSTVLRPGEVYRSVTVHRFAGVGAS